MIKCKVVKDFYYSKTKQAYREGREYLFTEEQYEELFTAGLVINEAQKEVKEITIKKPKIKKYKK